VGAGGGRWQAGRQAAGGTYETRAPGNGIELLNNALPHRARHRDNGSSNLNISKRRRSRRPNRLSQWYWRDICCLKRARIYINIAGVVCTKSGARGFAILGMLAKGSGRLEGGDRQ